MYGPLTDREQAIWEAKQWQERHAAENTPSPVNDAWTVIVGLLMQLRVNAAELRAIEDKLKAEGR